MDVLTDQLNTLISNELSPSEAWNSVPGGLDKISSSSMGFAWGIGGGKVYYCQLPCSGNWQISELAGSPLDVTTDDMKVYVLLSDSLVMKTANNTDEWHSISIPPGIQKIISTSSYIWGQAGTQKLKLPKPGMSGNWIPVADPLNIKIISASSTSLYGVDSLGTAMKTDESMQSGWAAIPDLAGSKYSMVLGDADQTALYGLDTTNQLKRCSNGTCVPITTQGYTPQNLSIEPISKQLWMTTTTKGDEGNIFTRTDNVNYSSLLQNTEPLDKQRDSVKQQSEQDFVEGTHTGIMTKQLNSIKEMLANIFKISPSEKIKSDASSKKSSEDITYTNERIQQLKHAMITIQDILMLLFVLVVIYLTSSIFGSFTHVIALCWLIGGSVYLFKYKQ